MTNDHLDVTGGNFSESFLRLWNRDRYCNRCGSRFQYTGVGEYRCRGCGKTELDDYGKVKEYLEEHGPSSPKVVAAATGVPEELIEELIKKGVIEVAGPEKDSFLKCQNCGKSIRTGRLCATCASRQLSGLQASFQDSSHDAPLSTGEAEDAPKRESPKMHTRPFTRRRR